MKRILILFSVISFVLFPTVVIAEELSDIVPSDELWGMTKEELRSVLYNCEERMANKYEALRVTDYSVGVYDMDAYYVFGNDMGGFFGLSKIAFLYSGAESNDDIRECRDTMIKSMTELLGEPDSVTKAVTTWNEETIKVEIGTGKFKNYTNSGNTTAGIVFTGLRFPKKQSAEMPSNVRAAKLTNFYLKLNADKTITLKSFDVHDEECYIPSHYTVDGKRYTVTYIDDACFFGRTSLKTLSLPEGVKTIADNAFNSCAIKNLYLPSSLKDVSGMFGYFSHSVTVYYAGSFKQWKAIKGTSECPSNVKVYCDTPTIQVVDENDYSSTSLTTERSEAEELGGALGNALNGLLLGLAGEE